MRKILLLVLFIAHFVYANNEAKFVYINKDVNFGELSYIGEILQITYNVLVLDNAVVQKIDFREARNNNIIIKNPDSPWTELEDGTLTNTFYMKISGSSFKIPQLEVIVKNGETEDREISQNIFGNAIALDSNHPLYSHVVAQNLEIQKYDIKYYDNNHNIVIMDLSAKHSNLEDFTLAIALNQGFKNSKFGIEESSAIYYAVVPNTISVIEFEYFDIDTQTYKMLHLNNIINKETIDINQDISPINKVLIFKNIVVFFVILVLLGLFFARKIPFKIRLTMLGIAVILMIYLVVSNSGSKTSIVLKDSYINILPTEHSTTIDYVPQGTKVQIINVHEDYYKISTSDGKIGWIKKENMR